MRYLCRDGTRQGYQGAIGLRERIAQLATHSEARTIAVGAAAVALTLIVEMPLFHGCASTMLQSGEGLKSAPR